MMLEEIGAAQTSRIDLQQSGQNDQGWEGWQKKWSPSIFPLDHPPRRRIFSAIARL
jgi:hypothetical protein